MTRNQAPVAEKFLGWWTSVLCVAEARCVFSIQESGRDLVIGSLKQKDADCLTTLFNSFIQINGDIKVYGNDIRDIVQYLIDAQISFNCRLTTQVNNGVKAGMSMGVNGLQSIGTYLNSHALSADSYLTISNGTN